MDKIYSFEDLKGLLPVLGAKGRLSLGQEQDP